MSFVGPIIRNLGFQSGYEGQLMRAISSDNVAEIRRCCLLGADFNTTLYHLYRYTPLILKTAVQIEN